MSHSRLTLCLTPATYLSSYGVLSRAGAGLLSTEFDHLGFHSRYISDYGLILNWMRTGRDPLDGDSLAFAFEDPDAIDPSTLRVLVVGEGAEGSYGCALSSSSSSSSSRARGDRRVRPDCSD